MNDFAAVGASTEAFFAAVAADKNVVSVGINGRFNFVGVEIFVAKVAKHEVIFDAMGTNVRAVADLENLCDGAILFAMFAKAVMRVEAVLADVNSLAVTVDDFPTFRSKVRRTLDKTRFRRGHSSRSRVRLKFRRHSKCTGRKSRHRRF